MHYIGNERMVSPKINPNSIAIKKNGGRFNRNYLVYARQSFYNNINPKCEYKKLVGNKHVMMSFSESDFMLILQDNKTILLFSVNRCDLISIYLGIKGGATKGTYYTSTDYCWTWCHGYVNIAIKSESIEWDSSVIRKGHESCIVMLPEQSLLLAVIEQQLFSLSFNHSEIYRLSVT